MFVIFVDYVKPLEEIDRLLDEHRAFLRDQYAAKRFLASGPMNPRIGGIILARNQDRAELERILEGDPFNREGAAIYTIHEFDPVLSDPAVTPYLG